MRLKYIWLLLVSVLLLSTAYANPIDIINHDCGRSFKVKIDGYGEITRDFAPGVKYRFQAKNVVTMTPVTTSGGAPSRIRIDSKKKDIVCKLPSNLTQRPHECECR